MTKEHMTILVVEDDPDLRAYVRRSLLALCPFVARVLEAETGGTAVEVVRKGGIDGLVMDVQLPGMDGLEACRLIEAGWPLPVLLISGESSRTGAAEGFAAEGGHRAFLAKPFNARRLARAVTELMGGV